MNPKQQAPKALPKAPEQQPSQQPGTGTPPAIVDKRTEMQKFLEGYKSQMLKVLPKFLPPDRMIALVLNTVAFVPRLIECDPKSFIRSILQCASLGLEPGPHRQHASFVPFWNSQRGR